MEKKISLSEGSGGEEMNHLINSFREILSSSKQDQNWEGTDDDSAYFDLGNGKYLVFTTDSYTIDPIFFPGGDIGHIAACGTINDLCVMGAKPLGISLGLIIEEGFSKDDLNTIIKSIEKVCSSIGISIVTGDTKVMEKGKLDKIIINTSGVGIAEKEELLNKRITEGDSVVISGSIGDHAVALLSKRFDFKTSLITDSQPLYNQITQIKTKIKVAKDPTRGGISGVLHDLMRKNSVGIILDESKIPIKKEVTKVSEMLGLDPYMLACEGRFICICNDDYSKEVLNILKRFESTAEIIGTVVKGDKLLLQTELGQRIIPKPLGRIVPRIC
jgi:hydrogenase expression/formation protein HypE